MEDEGGASPGLDPIFQKAEPEARPQKPTQLLWQYFFFPVLIVVGALGVYLLFGLLGANEDTPAELIDTVVNGGENAQKQAAQQLAILISQARTEADGARAEGKPAAPFYAEAAFKQQLRRAFQLALEEESPERQQWLAKALGRAEVFEALPDLLGVVYPAQGERDKEVRRAAASGILHLESRQAERALLRMARDRTDPQIRVIAYSGLALLGLERHGGAAADDAAVGPALRKGLDDPTPAVRLNAAYALALRGDDGGLHLIETSLDREALGVLGIAPAFVKSALLNGIRAATQLGTPALRARIERLTRDDVEPSDQVRAQAREALTRWAETEDASHGG